MNPHLGRLQPYPFEKLARLKAGVIPPDIAHIAMSIGEPTHEPPADALQILRDSMRHLGRYPATHGLPELRAACARWLERRFALSAGSVDESSMILPVNGTREALFAFAQAVIDPRGKPAARAGRGDSRTPVVAMPNPFYQIYEGAALLAGAEPLFLAATPESRFTPDLDAVPAETWERCQLLYLCSPGNPTGTILSLRYLQQALDLAERYDFLVAGDECYSELYLDESAPPPSLLQAAWEMGRRTFERCVVFHSLSKRSSLPGLRSGFVAGDPRVLERFLLYRTYHGCAMPVPTQLASIAAWSDEQHVRTNRDLYREKFARVLPILQPVLDVDRPDGAFYLWPNVTGDDETFARELFARKHVTVLPGRYLARETAGGNPGSGRVRISLVAPLEECVTAAQRIRDFVTSCT